MVKVAKKKRFARRKNSADYGTGRYLPAAEIPLPADVRRYNDFKSMVPPTVPPSVDVSNSLTKRWNRSDSYLFQQQNTASQLRDLYK